jgi:hypothetical protein
MVVFGLGVAARDSGTLNVNGVESSGDFVGDEACVAESEVPRVLAI